MAIAVTIESTIARPPEDVFARIADIDAWPTWLIASGIVRVERASDGPLAADERLVVEQRAAGRAGTFQASVTALQPPTRFALQGKDEDGVSIDIEALLAPADAGTNLRWSIRIGLPLRYRMFESMARPQVERAAALDIEALRIGLEQPTG
jgi:uncharacterized protein YndB with AHSA1/START domain